MFVSFAVLVLWTLLGAVAAPADLVERQRGGGGGGNFYSSYWTDNGEKVNYKNGAGGEFSVTWSGTQGNFVCGKGWNSGGTRFVDQSSSSTRDVSAH
jgi:endo-1,4-beta-xylanase